MIKTDGTPTIAWATPITNRDPGDETATPDRFLLDEAELKRRLAQAYAQGFEAGQRLAHALLRFLPDPF